MAARAVRGCLLVLLLGGGTEVPAAPQQPLEQPVQQQVEQLAAAVEASRAQLAASARQIEELRRQVVALEARLDKGRPDVVEPDPAAASRLQAEVDALRERSELEASELATHEQAKVETESRFPLKLTGLLLATAFANTGTVDQAAAPTVAAPGPGTTGISLRQTILGLDARGPHLFGAQTRADLRGDFFGGAGQGGYSAGNGLLRLRTAHASAEWSHTQTRAFVELDRPIVSPLTPTSLTALAQPALAWSGNLWNWIPQIGLEHRLALAGDSSVLVTAAVADVPDPALPSIATGAGPSQAEQSRRPASELHLAFSGAHPGGEATGSRAAGPMLGAGAYYSPHRIGSSHYDAWAATLDYRLPLTSRFELTGAAYRGLGLGGLGGGAYKDDVYTLPDGVYTFKRPLGDVGGWAQLKARATARLEVNADFGLDNAFASQLRAYAPQFSGSYQGLARNSTLYTNAIYSPSAYTLFSFEYRRLLSTPVTGLRSSVDVYGLAAGYRF